jgi:inner membrane protein
MGGTALVLGANLPDIDVITYLGGPGADLAGRRGWTHGVLALSVLPFALTGLLLLLERQLRSRRSTEVPAVETRQLLLLSTVAILSHPILDSLNTYGVRWLMPFSHRWFYGDALFIVDPWVWLVLGAGVFWSWRLGRKEAPLDHRPARVAIGLVGLYMVSMWVSGLMAAGMIAREVAVLSNQPVQQVMAGPLPVTPITRNFVVEQSSLYRVGTFQWLADPHIDVTRMRSFPRGRPKHPAMAVAETTLTMRRFLTWARYPTFEIRQVATDHYQVDAVDLRYAREPGTGFGTMSVPVRPERGSGSPGR